MRPDIGCCEEVFTRLVPEGPSKEIIAAHVSQRDHPKAVSKWPLLTTVLTAASSVRPPKAKARKVHSLEGGGGRSQLLPGPLPLERLVSGANMRPIMGAPFPDPLLHLPTRFLPFLASFRQMGAFSWVGSSNNIWGSDFKVMLYE